MSALRAFLVALVALLALAALPAWSADLASPRCAVASPPACGFYANCIERACPCGHGIDGYALDFGRKYCRRALAIAGLSPQGRLWRDAAMACLQRELLEALPASGCDCGRIRREAYASHFACYVNAETSVCDLPPADIARIVASIDRDDRAQGRGLRQALRLAARCFADNPENARAAWALVRAAPLRWER